MKHKDYGVSLQKLDDCYKMTKVSVYFKILRSSLKNHYLGITTSTKRGPQGVLTAENEKILILYLDKMIVLSNLPNLSQLKLKVIEITQERVTPFKIKFQRIIG